MAPRALVTAAEDSSTSGLSSPLSELDGFPFETSRGHPKGNKRGASEAIESREAKKPRQSRVEKLASYKEDSDEGESRTPQRKGIRKIKKSELVESSAPFIAARSNKKLPKIVLQVEPAEPTSSRRVTTTTHVVETITNGKVKKARSRAVKAEKVEHDAVAVQSETEAPKQKARPRKRAAKTTEEPGEEATAEPKIKRHRKTKEEKEAEAMPLAGRTLNPKIILGAHVSAAGGVFNGVTNALHIGGNAFALFLKSQRKWENPPLKPEVSRQFRSLCEIHQYSSAEHIVPHGSYLVNLAQANAEKGQQAYNSFLDDLQRCETLGVRLYNFHPGNTGGEPRAMAIVQLAARLNDAHRATSNVVTLLENMAAHPSGNTLGSTFADLRDIIAKVHDKSRVGVCLDTCHAFAAGYDLRSPSAFAATLAEFENTVGIKYLRAVHVNDSKAPFASHRDLHANIGTGFLGLRAFHNLVNDPRFAGLPLVLETPIDKKDANGKVVEDKGVWAREIKMLEGLVGMDVEGDEFLKLEGELAEQGRVEREKHQEQYDRKTAEMAKKAADGKSRKKKGEKTIETSSSEGETEGSVA